MARPGFRNHPKYRRLVRLLNLPDPYVYGLCEFLWSVAYESGNPIIGDEMDIELAAGWSGEKGALCAALLASGGSGRAGLIEPVSLDDHRLQIHDLSDHAPDYVGARAVREIERSKEKKCGVCEVIFHSPDRRAIYCSDACKQTAYRQRMLPTVTNASVTDTDGSVTNGVALPTVTDRYGTPAPAPAPLFNTSASDEAVPTDDEIYRAYPRLKEPTAAKAAIAKALKAIRQRGESQPRVWLMGRVKLYAAARRLIADQNPGEAAYTPYPRKWFNTGGYDEDPSTWTTHPPKRTNGNTHPLTSVSTARREDN